jgi:putative Mg2+ transporter-C (MgtC) family protein
MISELELVIRIILSFLLSALVGLEREIRLKPAGLRTHILVGLGSSLLTILSLYAFPGSDPARVAASIAVGIGFIGAGTIIKTKEKIIGLTTASTLWITASIGVAAGAGFYLVGSVVALITYITLELVGRFEKEIEKEISKA